MRHPLILSTLVISGFFLAACGDSTEETPDTQDPVVVTVTETAPAPSP